VDDRERGTLDVAPHGAALDASASVPGLDAPVIRQPAMLEPWNDLLACPICRGAITCGVDELRCQHCDRRFPQPHAAWIDLLPTEFANTDWEARQDFCDAWYLGEWSQSGAEAPESVDYYLPHREFLESLCGRVLDVGGGDGTVLRHMPSIKQYATVEPSLIWFGRDDSRNSSLSDVHLLPVRGVGEHIPFRESSFDAVVSFWSFNHVVDPAAVLREMKRVLKSGGRLLLVLEDMIPTWWDLLFQVPSAAGRDHARRLARKKLNGILTRSAWATQPDHLFISERQLRSWTVDGFRPTRRKWIADNLTLEFRRL